MSWCATACDGESCDCLDVKQFLVNLDAENANGTWHPNRRPLTVVGGGWEDFIETLKLARCPDTERVVLVGQDGWAFDTAIRFQHAACELAESDEPRFWSSYYLLARIIERARADTTFLEAIEALADAHLYGGLSKAQVTQQFRSLGVWP